MRILAHRGASGYAPENTIASFDLACRMGAPALETDVRVTRDGVAVLIHDEHLDRTTDGTGPVADMDWNEIAALDAGAWYGPTFAGERVPSLSAFMDRYLGQVSVCLEVKCAQVIGPIAGALRERPGSLARMEFTSFEWDLLQGLRQAVAGATLGFLVRRANADASSIRRVADAGMAMICPPASVVTPDWVAEAHAAGLGVRTWGVNTTTDLAHVIACNVDGTTLNWPDWHGGLCPSLANAPVALRD